MRLLTRAPRPPLCAMLVRVWELVRAWGYPLCRMDRGGGTRMATDEDAAADGQPVDENFDQALRFAHDLARFRAAATPNRASEGEKPPTLVMADDEPALRRLVRTTLSGEGYEVIKAGTRPGGTGRDP